MLGVFAPVIGPPQVGSWLTVLVVALGIVAFISIVIMSGWSHIRSRRRSKATTPSLPKYLPKAA